MEQAVSFPPGTFRLGYVREYDDGPVKTFALVDADGMAVLISTDRSSCFFAAVKYDIQVVSLH